MVRRMELLRCRRRDGAPAQGTATSDEERLSRLRVQNCLCLDDAVLYTVSCESFSHAMLFRGCLRKAAVCAPGRRQQSPGTCATWKGAHLRRGLQERQPVSLHDPDAVPLERFASLTIIGDLDCGREADETSRSVGQRTGSHSDRHSLGPGMTAMEGRDAVPCQPELLSHRLPAQPCSRRVALSRAPSSLWGSCLKVDAAIVRGECGRA